ncbi:mandelate racemase/muconate lactonizing enzyme family protein [Rhizobium binxianense]
MKITSVHGYHLAFQLPEAVGNSTGFFDRREAFVLRLEGEGGISGWGEASAVQQAVSGYIRQKLAKIVLGRPAHETGKRYAEMTEGFGYDRQGTAMLAVSAVDMALHDAAAREQGVSISTMLGGALRERVLAYASGPFFKPDGDPYRDFEKDTDALLSRHFKAIKPRCGYTPEADGRMASALRRQLGPDRALMVDINQGYTAAAAVESARHMQEAGLLWIEEPVRPDDIPGYLRMAQASSTAIAGGESLSTLAGFRDFLAAGCVSVLQPDLSICGGYSGFRRVAALAEAYGISVMPHVFGTVVNLMSSLQMAAVLKGYRGGGPLPYPFIECDATYNPLLALAGDVRPEADGCVAVPDRPGIGLDLTEGQLAPFVTEHWVERL